MYMDCTSAWLVSFESGNKIPDIHKACNMSVLGL